METEGTANAGYHYSNQKEVSEDYELGYGDQEKEQFRDQGGIYSPILSTHIVAPSNLSSSAKKIAHSENPQQFFNAPDESSIANEIQNESQDSFAQKD